MGRYYDGDIQGKFWFGVQASDDAEFFGAVGCDPQYVDYYVTEIEPVREGVETCITKLGEDKARLDEFFSAHDSYNENMMQTWWKDKYNIDVSFVDITRMLQWYARLELGNKILKCMEENGECNFMAEV